jgi:hypothetical protein
MGHDLWMNEFSDIFYAICVGSPELADLWVVVCYWLAHFRTRRVE